MRARHRVLLPNVFRIQAGLGTGLALVLIKRARRAPEISTPRPVRPANDFSPVSVRKTTESGGRIPHGELINSVGPG